jgi:hypothetical protein
MWLIQRVSHTVAVCHEHYSRERQDVAAGFSRVPLSWCLFGRPWGFSCWRLDVGWAYSLVPAQHFECRWVDILVLFSLFFLSFRRIISMACRWLRFRGVDGLGSDSFRITSVLVCYGVVIKFALSVHHAVADSICPSSFQ